MESRDDIHQQKQRLRREHRERRQNQTPSFAAEAARHAARHLEASPLWQSSRHLGLFIANDGELDPSVIASAARRAQKTLYLPSLQGQTLDFRYWGPTTPLRPNRYGIDESMGAIATEGVLDLLLMPLVAWSPQGARLGMGGGFYDRFVAAQREHGCPFLLGLAYDDQQDPRIDALQESWDQPLDGVLTESGLTLFESAQE